MTFEIANWTHLEDVEAACLAALERAGRAPGDPLRWPALSTLAMDGTPAMRTVVLRDFSAASRTANIWTDRRSAKVAELERDGRCGLHFLDPEAMLQIRAIGTGRVEVDGAHRDATFERASRGDLGNYTSRLPPGSPLPGPEYDQEPAIASDNFAVLSISINQMEIVRIGAEGSCRVRLDWRAGYSHAWLVP